MGVYRTIAPFVGEFHWMIWTSATDEITIENRNGFQVNDCTFAPHRMTRNATTFRKLFDYDNLFNFTQNLINMQYRARHNTRSNNGYRIAHMSCSGSVNHSNRTLRLWSDRFYYMSLQNDEFVLLYARTACLLFSSIHFIAERPFSDICHSHTHTHTIRMNTNAIARAPQH